MKGRDCNLGIVRVKKQRVPAEFMNNSNEEREKVLRWAIFIQRKTPRRAVGSSEKEGNYVYYLSVINGKDKIKKKKKSKIIRENHISVKDSE